MYVRVLVSESPVSGDLAIHSGGLAGYHDIATPCASVNAESLATCAFFSSESLM